MDNASTRLVMCPTCRTAIRDIDYYKHVKECQKKKAEERKS